MQVRLKNNWLGPDGHLYRRRTDGKTTYVPSAFEDRLPSSAEVASREKDTEGSQPGNPKADLHDLDLERAAGDAAEARRVKAEAFARAVREGREAKKKVS